MKYLYVFLIVIAVILAVSAQAKPRSSCECEELARIRVLLEHQFRLVCDERHCEGLPPPDGGELP